MERGQASGSLQPISPDWLVQKSLRFSRSEVFDCEATPELLDERAGRAGRVWLALAEGTLKYALRRKAGAGTWQLFCFDPNGAKVELDFDASEMM